MSRKQRKLNQLFKRRPPSEADLQRGARQLRRIETLVDCVYALFIVLTVFELPLPADEGLTGVSVSEFLRAHVDAYLPVLIAIVLVVLYWIQNNVLFGNLSRTDFCSHSGKASAWGDRFTRGYGYGAAVFPGSPPREHLGSIRGATWCCTVAGSGCGPLLMGLSRDLAGGFEPAIVLFLAVMSVLAVLVWWATPPRISVCGDSTGKIV